MAPRNHDYNSGVLFADFRKPFQLPEVWLVNDRIVLPAHDLELIGFGKRGVQALKPPEAGRQICSCIFRPIR
jgi:hypothetical protein